MENRQGYDPSEFEEEEGYLMEQPAAEKSIRGYRIVIIILSAILVALSILYFSIHRQQMIDNELLQADRDSIQNDLGRLMTDYDNLQITNDSDLGEPLDRTRKGRLADDAPEEGAFVEPREDQAVREGGGHPAHDHAGLRPPDRLAEHAQQEAHQGERRLPQGEIPSANLRADMAEEKAAELDNKVRIGAVRARDIALLALNANSREVSRIKNAARLRVDFTISANELAAPGDKTVYVRITSPDGYVLTTEAMPTFEFEGERLSYSAQRTVQYDNTQDLDVGIFYASTGFTAGTYKVQLYCEGRLIGQADIAMR